MGMEQLFVIIFPSNSMSLFGRILSEFNKIKYNEKSQFDEYEINHAMDQLSRLNAGYEQFDRQVAEQLWQHTTKNPAGKVLLKDYIQTIIDARNILKENIYQCSKQLTFEQDPQQRQEIEECLLSYGEDHRILGQPLLLEQLPSRNVSMSQSGMESRQGISQHQSQIFTETASWREESTSLKIVLIILVILFGCEILGMFVRHHFLNFMAYLAVLSIFALNYFDPLYLKFTEVTLTVSSVLDLIWVITHSGDYWSPVVETQYSHLQDGFLKLVYILAIIGMGLKLLVIIILFRFTKNKEETVKVVCFLNRRIQLSGRAGDNPLTALLASKKGP